MQLAKASKDLLILAPSNKRIPLFPVRLPLSLPAKSISDNLEMTVFSLVFLVLDFLEIVI